MLIAALSEASQKLPATAESKRRIISIQVCRGLAAVMVVFNHLHNIEMKYFQQHLLHGFQYGNLGVDLFLVIGVVTLGKQASDRRPGRFLYHRLTRVFPIYWFYTAIVAAAFLYNPLWINATAGHHVDILASFMLVPTHVPMLIMQGWTLTYELYFYAVVFLTLLLPQRATPYLLTLWGLAILAVLVVPHQLFPPVLVPITSPSVFEFLAGYGLFALTRRVAMPRAGGWLLVALSVVWFAGLVVWTDRYHEGISFWIENSAWYRPALYGTFSLLLLFGMMELERSGFLRFPRFLEVLGDWSYSVYLSHLLVVELVARVAVHSYPHLPLAGLLLTVLSLPLVLLVGGLSYHYLERPLLGFFYRAPWSGKA